MKLGVEIINFKITIGRTIFNFSCKTSVFARLGALFGQFLVIFGGAAAKRAAKPPGRRRSRRKGGEAARPAGRRSRSDLLPAGRRERGTRYDSPKLIVDSEVRGTTRQS